MGNTSEVIIQGTISGPVSILEESGSTSTPQTISGASSTLETSGSISTPQTIGGSTITVESITGNISSGSVLSGSTTAPITSGSVSSDFSVSGSTTVPKTLDRTAIHYDTTEAWDSTPNLIAAKGHIYIYKDYDQRTNPDGTKTLIPAMKIGDGTSYLIDMPFFSAGQNEDELWNHINNWSIHVSADDRSNWTTKVSATVDEPRENLILVM